MQRISKISVFILILLLSAIGVGSTVSHYLPPPSAEILESLNPPPGKEWFLEQLPRYASRPVMTALHVIPAFLFMLMVPFQLANRIRKKNIAIHRNTGRIFVILSIFIGISGIAFGIIMPFGGFVEVVASILIGAGFFYSLATGVARVRQKRIIEHREWMLRMLAFGFTPITMRGILAGGMLMFDLPGQAIFGWTLLIGMAINIVAVETWIYYSRVNKVPVTNLTKTVTA